MDRHAELPHEAVRPGREASPRTILLVGNPNVGKSVLFSKLTGTFVIISNYPGTTVELTKGTAQIGGDPFTVIDTPGVNELAPRSEDARVTSEVLRDHPDAPVIQVADARNLRRALLLTLELAAMRRPMILVLNMMDELEHSGARIDTDELSATLGIPVVATVAVRGAGMEALKAAARRAAIPSCPTPPVPPPNSADSAHSAHSYEQTVERLAVANTILARVYRAAPPRSPRFSQRLAAWATHPVKGIAMLAAALYLMFWFVGLFGAGTCVDFLETVAFGRGVSPVAIHVVDRVLPFPHQHEQEASDYTFSLPLSPTHGIAITRNVTEVTSTDYNVPANLTTGQRVMRFFHDFLVGKYGVITMALSYGFAIVLPIVTTFFLLFGILEDSGYLPRLAVMLNKFFRGMGLNGKAVLPMVLGLGCDTMATMTTRILETRKERVITTLLLALAVPCSAQLGVLLAMTARVSFAAALVWLAVLIGTLFLVGWLAAKIYDGETSDFVLELPPMRLPQVRNVAVKTVARLDWYLREVIPLFVLGTGALFLLDQLKLLGKIASFGAPLIHHWLGLPAQTASAFLIGFLRRDYGAVYLLDAATGAHPLLTPHQVLVSMVTITLFMPCIATLFMISRELGQRTAAAITVFVFTFAFLVGGLVHHLALLLGV